MTAPVILRKYRQKGFRLSPELHRNRTWWYSAVGNREPRTSPLEQLKPFGAHADSLGHGRIPAVYYTSSRNCVHLHLPR